MKNFRKWTFTLNKVEQNKINDIRDKSLECFDYLENNCTTTVYNGLAVYNVSNGFVIIELTTDCNRIQALLQVHITERHIQVLLCE